MNSATSAASAVPPVPPLHAADSAGHAEAPPAADTAAPGVFGAVGTLWDDLRDALAERGRLLTLELKRSGIALVQLVVFGVLVALLALTAWLGLVAAAVVALASFGLHWALAIAVGVVLNALVAYLLLRAMVRLFGQIGLSSSLQHLHTRRAD